MNLRRIFRRTRPTPPAPSLHPQDLATITWYGLTETEWHALTNPERAHYRTVYMKVRMP